MDTNDFQNWLVNEKRSPGNTAWAYGTDIKQFLDFIQDSFNLNTPELANKQQVKSWLANLMEQNVQPSSIKRKLSAVKTYYRFLKETTDLTTNPAEGINAPKPPKRLVKYAEESDMITLLDHIDWGEDEKGLRNRLIVEMLYGTGLRLSELISLKVGDIGKDSITVIGKGKKDRAIPLNNTLNQRIAQYFHLLKGYRQLKQDEFLFLTDKGKPIYPMYVYRVVNKALSGVTSLSSKSPHKLRHAFATHLLNKGADLNAIKTLLGHSGLAATQVYTQNSVEKLKSVYKQAHPKANNNEN